MNTLVSPIGYIESCFTHKNGTPRQPGLVQDARARLKIDTPALNNPQFSLEGLQDFSHIWLLFWFHLDKPGGKKTVKSKVAPPRHGGVKRGLFATRSPHRPTPIGLSLVRLLEVADQTLLVDGVDLVHGTPVLDVKPYIPAFDQPQLLAQATPVQVPHWAESKTIVSDRLGVSLTRRAHQQLKAAFEAPRDTQPLLATPEQFLSVLGGVLAGDPRSIYRKDQCSDRLYFVELDGLHITAWFDQTSQGEHAEVLRIRPYSQSPG
jgi:tRNA-Thr(GGU) m(6)t(6)A37 methyltransferase TsaA